MLATRYTTEYDGIIVGAMAFDLGKSTMASAQAMQRLAADATSQGLLDPNGVPAINKLYTDADLTLVAGAVLSACDATDGLVDGIASRPQACTSALVDPQLDA